MKRDWKKIILYALLLALVVGAILYLNKDNKPENDPDVSGITEDGYYYSAEDVSAYLIKYGRLPSNYVSKEEAQAAGWSSGSVEEYIEGAAIGGESFGNKEKLLPEKNGRKYYVCDIDTHGKDDRGEKRLVYSNDGLIYYTEDYFKTFTLISGDEGDKPSGQGGSEGQESSIKVEESGKYYDKDHVALYIHTYGKLPTNYVTKKEAEAAGWSGGSVQKYIEGAAIGGDRFGNNEGKLPKKSGRQYYECDIDTDGKSKRGSKRIIYSNDGLIYYTGDHYESFTLLYGEE
ncbi:MAG: hypothetical protein J5528_00920 [Firmicutes bacterium]|nr:hypothetical protein [Bacillota bacterium]